ncbi:MAG: amidohydrolase family protein [Ilumatobacteraceae bacterium]
MYRQNTDEAIARLDDQLTRYRTFADGRLGAWSTVVGHTTCSDPLWKAARELADSHDVGLSFHMSPAKSDPDGFIAEFGQRPFEHLDEIGVLGDDACATHCVHVDDREIDAMARTGTSVAHCPTTALKAATASPRSARCPKWCSAASTSRIGTDGNNASNYSDPMQATYLVAGLFKDGRTDPQMFPRRRRSRWPPSAVRWSMTLDDQIGSLEVGKRVDVVLHDTDRPEWRPLFNAVNQLVWSADGRGVHTVLVDGRVVVEDGHMTTIDLKPRSGRRPRNA